MLQEPRYDSSGDGTQFISYNCDSGNRLTTIDRDGYADFAAYDAFGRLTQRRPAQIDKTAAGTGTAPVSPSPSSVAWSFGRFAPRHELDFELYIAAPSGLNREDWQNDYTVSGGKLTLAADPGNTPFGDGWYKLGTVTVPACTLELRVCYHGRGSQARCAIMLVRKLSKP